MAPGKSNLERTIREIPSELKPPKKPPQSATGSWYRIWLNDGLSLSAEEINGLPEKLRRYIHDIETRSDPAGDVAQIASLTEQRDALVNKVKELERESQRR